MSEINPESPEVEDSYVVLQKFSNANPSKYYRIVHFIDYRRYVDGELSSLPMVGQRSTYQQARDLCDLFNEQHKSYKEAVAEAAQPLSDN
jgi:dsDNA-specific endonuclease/ATPase MutS2